MTRGVPFPSVTRSLNCVGGIRLGFYFAGGGSVSMEGSYPFESRFDSCASATMIAAVCWSGHVQKTSPKGREVPVNESGARTLAPVQRRGHELVGTLTGLEGGGVAERQTQRT